MMEEFKILVTEVLTPHASAILLDPEWGLPASKRRAKNAGLLLAYEKTGYDKTGPGRCPICWIIGRLADSRRLEPISSRSYFTIRRLNPRVSTTASMPGWNA